MLKSLHLHGWRQFASVDVSFHPKLTMLTGENGTGKTTILNILSRHLGWDTRFTSTPKRDKENKSLWIYFTGLYKKLLDKPEVNAEIGKIEYDTGPAAVISSPGTAPAEYKIPIQSLQNLPGIYLPSHRPYFRYAQVGSTKTAPPVISQLLDSYTNQWRNFYTGGGRQHPNYMIKETLLSLAVYGYGNEVVDSNDKMIEIYEGFQRVLSLVLPKNLGYKKLAIRIPEIVLVTESGEFLLDAVSGGISSIIDMAWQLYLSSINSDNFIVLIDEPENHLHPAMQRTLVPDLLKSFPNAQFIISTHNPIIVSSVKESNIYALYYNQDRRVECNSVDLRTSLSKTHGVLREILGLDLVMPQWLIEDLSNAAYAELGESGTEEQKAVITRYVESNLAYYAPELARKMSRKDR